MMAEARLPSESPCLPRDEEFEIAKNHLERAIAEGAKVPMPEEPDRFYRRD